MRNIAVTLLLALVAAATWFATWQRRGTVPTVERSAEVPPLGYYVRGARMTGTDEQGRVAYRVLAERLEELPDDDRLQLWGVIIEYRPPDETAWSISAASASSPKSGSPLDLAGNVEIKSIPTDGSQPRTVAAETLRYWPTTAQAESDAHVRISIGDWHLNAAGLRADLKGDTLALESPVHGTFVPQ